MGKFLTIISLLLGCCFAVPLHAMSLEEETKLGREEHRKIVAQVGVYKDPQLQAYVNKVGQRVAAESSRQELEYTFTILNDPAINAMALPGGFIYITRGMLAHLNSEAELAAVLGHELAHVTEKHAIRRQQRGQGLQALNVLAAIATGQQALYDLGNLFGGVLLSGYSREFELEADEVGAKYMAKAGYSPEAMINTIEILKAKDRVEIKQAKQEGRKPNVYHGFLSTHPDNDTRYKEAIRASKRLVIQYDEFIKADEFLRRLNGLTYGPNRQAGVVRGNRFYHPRLGIKFAFPKSWHFTTDPHGVTATSQNGEATFMVSTARYAQGMTPKKAADEALGLEVREGRAITIAGMPAYVGIADRVSSPYGPRPARFAVVFDEVRRTAYLLSGTGQFDLRKIANDQDFIATIFSFDRMDGNDFRLAKRPKVQVVRAEEGTTMEQLAADSPITTYALDKLRVMNGLYPKGQPEPGQLIKIIN